MTPLITLVRASFLARFGYQMARSPVLPRFAQDLGAAPEMLGLIVAASTITGVAIKLPAGALSDVLGRKRMMLLGCLFFAAPPFLYPFVYSASALLALRFLHGFATAIFGPVASAYVADLSEQGRGEKLGWFAAAGDLGSTVGPLLSGLILFYTASYTTIYLIVGGLGLLPLFMVLRLPDDERPHVIGSTLGARSGQFWSGIQEVLSSHTVVLASALEAAMYVGYGAFLGFFPPYAREIGLNDAQIGLVMGVQLATTMLAKPLSGRLSDRLGRKPLVADFVVAGRMGSAMGVFGTIWDTGEAAGPILAGFLIASLSYAPAFTLIAALMAVVALIFAIFVRDPHTAYEQA